jgi:cyclase
MTRSIRRLSIAALSLGLTVSLGLPVHAADADPFAGVAVTAEKVAGSVYMLMGSGGNIGLSVGADGTLMVDDQYAPLSQRIQAAIASVGGDEPRIILNTHYHGDHTGSNPQFGTSGTIIAHENVRIRLLDEEDFARTGLPVVTFEDKLRIYFNDDELDVLHLPAGHTDGDAIVWFKNANVLHLGDHFFNGMFPFVDLQGGGSVRGFIKNMRTIIAMAPEDIRIIPGHGKLGNILELSENAEMIESTFAAVEAALAAGKTEQEIIDAGVEKRWKSYA